MNDMSVDTVFQRGSDGDRDRQWMSEPPVWAHIGAFMERVAAFCGTHSAGYICPPSQDNRSR